MTDARTSSSTDGITPELTDVVDYGDSMAPALREQLGMMFRASMRMLSEQDAERSRYVIDRIALWGQADAVAMAVTPDRVTIAVSEELSPLEALAAALQVIGDHLVDGSLSNKWRIQREGLSFHPPGASHPSPRSAISDRDMLRDALCDVESIVCAALDQPATDVGDPAVVADNASIRRVLRGLGATAAATRSSAAPGIAGPR